MAQKAQILGVMGKIPPTHKKIKKLVKKLVSHN